MKKEIELSPRGTLVETELEIENARLEVGETFGELALLKNKPLATTARCMQDCDFAVIYKKNFNGDICIFFY